MSLIGRHYKTKYNFQLSSFMLHIIAMVLMLCDHLWGTILSSYDWLTCIGRIAFPLFAFLLVEGFVYTKNLKKYILRLFIFALISEIPFDLMIGNTIFYPIHQNVLWTFLLAVAALIIFEKLRTRRLVFRLIAYPIIIFIFYLLGIITFVDYYGCGILTVILFYFTRKNKKDTKQEKILKIAVQILGMYWINCSMLKGMIIPLNLFGRTVEVYQQGFAMFSLIFIWLYKGRQGLYNRYIKYFYYWFYPIHILILDLVVLLF